MVKGLGFNPRAREGHDCIARHSQTARSGFNPRAREGHDVAE